MKNKRFSILLGFLTILLSACIPSVGTPTFPERTFSALDLLLNSSDLPQEWLREQPYTTDGYSMYDTRELSTVLFSSFYDDHEVFIRHKVMEFINQDYAKIKFDLHFSNPAGFVPPGWSFHSGITDVSTIRCLDLVDAEGREIPYCTWAAKYEEFIVEFSFPFYLDNLGIEEIEEIIITTDSIMESYLR